MPSTHLSLHVHIVFSTKSRFPHIVAPWRPHLHQYLGGSLRGLRATPLQIGGTADHVHLLVGLNATHAIADLVREVKKAATNWVHESTGDGKFAWQEGYGAFSVSRRNLPATVEYIQTQEEHHRVRTFQEEYLSFLAEEGVEYNPSYLW